jgi:alpha-amylase/alpha-mannosidase (GH57 family)
MMNKTQMRPSKTGILYISTLYLAILDFVNTVYGHLLAKIPVFSVRIHPIVLLLSILALTSCDISTQVSTSTPAEPTAQPTLIPTATKALHKPAPIYLAMIWHQHQPVYYKDPETDVYAKPWVRLHAAKDYVDMATILNNYPNVHVTFNLTPSLIRQLEDLVNGAQDAYWIHTEIPANELDEKEKRFILRYFYDINPKIIARFPRYVELQAARPTSEVETEAALASWTAQDFRDLQVLFNLGWTDPDFLAQAPLSDLVQKGRDFNEEDKEVILDEHVRFIKAVLPVHKMLQETGQIEVTTTPFAHPILPLLIDTTWAKIAMPAAELPDPPFRYAQDAVEHLRRGISLYRQHFETAPQGMWPAEGSVAQPIVAPISQQGIRWMASDEGVLAKSIGLMEGFSRGATDPETGLPTVQEADALYRPYEVVDKDGNTLSMVFRDVVISDKVGFEYSGLPGEVAADDFINRIHAIRRQLQSEGTATSSEDPHLVTVILDGENAWEHYANDGKAFLNALYQKLSEDEGIITVTPSEYLERFPEEPSRQIAELWPGSWINHDFATWIGEEEENRAWDYLRRTREMLQTYLDSTVTPPSDEALAEAKTLMYIAEGSDWFWWYGDDQNSGDDEGFDRQYRDTLTKIYRTLDEDPPQWLSVPIVAAPPEATVQEATALLSPTIDGIADEGEWTHAGYYSTTQETENADLARLYYGFDAQHLYLRAESTQDWNTQTNDGRLSVECYLSLHIGQEAVGEHASAFSRYGDPGTYLGFGATHLVEVALGAHATGILSTAISTFNGERWTPIEGTIIRGLSDRTLEIGIPLALLGYISEFKLPVLPSHGDHIQMRLILSQGSAGDLTPIDQLPTDSYGMVIVPELGETTPILGITDPEEDDHGPGSYTYPTDPVFKPGVFDATAFSVGHNETDIVFQLTLRGPIENVWDSANGISVQTVDIYIDQDGPETGARMLLPGRNAALTPDYAWDYAIWVEGWTPGIYVPGEEEPQPVKGASLTAFVNTAYNQITIKVPKTILGNNPNAWHYAAVVLGQEGYPPAGVWRVRDVNPQAAQWRFGGGPEDKTHTRIIDVLWPEDNTSTQEAMLSTYTPADTVRGQDPDVFAQLQMLKP